jgi:hypothetical protein
MTSRAVAELVPANQILIKRTKQFYRWMDIIISIRRMMDMVEKYERVAVVGYSGGATSNFGFASRADSNT